MSEGEKQFRLSPGAGLRIAVVIVHPTATEAESAPAVYPAGSALNWYDDYLGNFPSKFAEATGGRATVSFAVGEGDKRGAETAVSESEDAAPAAPVAGLSETDKAEILDMHNRYRCMHGAPLLEWSAAVAESAQTWADQDEFAHSPRQDRQLGGVQHGENLFVSSMPLSTSDLEERAVKAWYDEVQHTEDGSAAGFSSQTGH